MGIPQAVRDRVRREWLVAKCKSRRGAVVFSRAFDDRLLIKLDLVRPRLRGPICDYLFFGSKHCDKRLWVVAVEFKAGRPNASEVVPQLVGGARYAESLLGRSCSAVFHPVVVFGGEIHRIDARRLGDTLIPFFHQRASILRGRTKMWIPVPGGDRKE